MEKKELKLIQPIEVLDTRHEVLYFRPIKAKDLRALPGKPTMGDLLDLVGRSTGLLKKEIDELSAEDAIAATEVIGDFLNGGRSEKDSEDT